MTPVTCHGEDDGVIAITTTGGTSPYQYKLGEGAFQGENEFSHLAPGNNYTVTVQDANGCEFNVTGITITEPGVLTIVPGSITPVKCYGESNGAFTFTITGGNTNYNVTVTKGNASFTSTLSEGVYTVANVKAGTYTVTVTDNEDCTDSEDFEVEEPDWMYLDISSSDESCDGGDGEATVVEVYGGNEGDYTYYWFNEDGSYMSDGPIATNLYSERDGHDGIYYVIVEDSKGCQRL